jgi:hypothetical protein
LIHILEQRTRKMSIVFIGQNEELVASFANSKTLIA